MEEDNIVEKEKSYTDLKINNEKRNIDEAEGINKDKKKTSSTSCKENNFHESQMDDGKETEKEVSESSHLLDAKADIVPYSKNIFLSDDENNVLENEVKVKANSTSAQHKNSKSSSAFDFMDKTDTAPRFSPNWKQFISALGPITMIFAAGLSSGYSATLLPHLRDEHSIILANENSASWIASIAVLPMAPCCFIGGWLIEKFGRRQTLRTLGIPFFIGWVIIIFSSNFTQMIIGRFINGCSIGLLNPSMSVFISESSSPKLRGMFLALLSFSFALGIFVSHLIGTWVSWQGTAIISAVLPMASVIILAFVPESPVWLLSKGKIDDGIKAFYWLRGYGENAKDELKAMIENFKSAEPPTGVWRDDIKKYNTPEFFKPLIITITFYLTCHYSGVHTITFYSVDIIEKAVGGGIDRYVAMLTIDALRVITTLITFLTSKNCPRRTLCILSGSLTAVSMIGLSIFLHFYNDEIPTHLTAIPLCFLSAFIISVNIGLMPLPLIIVGEIFPANVRSFGAGISSCIGYASIFIVVKTAPGMMADFGQVFAFSFYGTVAFVGTTILYFILPETKGKSLLEIEAIFKRKKSRTVP